MEEKSFLQILKENFINKDRTELLKGDNRKITIPVEWVFTEGIDRKVIEKTMGSLLNKNNSIYKSKDKIKNFEMCSINGTFQITINGIDNWTRAIISENPYRDGTILNVSEEEFFHEILSVLKQENIQEILEELKISDEEAESLESLFLSKSNIDELTLKGIKDSMSEAANNLCKYYDYLKREESILEEHSIKINQRKDAKEIRKINASTASQRKNPVYEFTERAKILAELNPERLVKARETDGTLTYITYVYENPRGKDGYLCISEPLEGSHSTRIKYITKEEYDKCEVQEGQNKIDQIVKEYLEMSYNEFYKKDRTKILLHTELENYSEKIKYFVTGEIGRNIKHNIKLYMAMQDSLYGERRISAEEIGTLGEGAIPSQIAKIGDMIIDIPTKEKE